MAPSAPLPSLVAAATLRAEAAGFPLSCDPDVGRLLAVLAGGLPSGARVLEIGTGTGVGTAWLVSGLLPRTDATVTTIELDAARARIAAQGDWPAFVSLCQGDALELLAGPERYDLIFADAPAGKTTGLELTIEALRPGGLLLVDDLCPQPDWPADLGARQIEVGERLLADPALTAVALPGHGSGVILASRRA